MAADAATLWLVSIDDPAARARAEAVPASAAELAEVAARADAGERLLRRRLAKALIAVAGTCHPDTVVIERGAAGEPLISAPAGWYISLAARWPLCLIGIARVPIGVDIERLETDPLPLDLLTETERKQLIQGDNEDGSAARCWAAKEAHAKWTGRPRDLDPAAIETAFPPLITSRFGTTRCWLRETADHVAAVCTT